MAEAAAAATGRARAKNKLPDCKTRAIVFHEHTDVDGTTCKLGFECLVEAADPIGPDWV